MGLFASHSFLLFPSKRNDKTNFGREKKKYLEKKSGKELKNFCQLRQSSYSSSSEGRGEKSSNQFKEWEGKDKGEEICEDIQ